MDWEPHVTVACIVERNGEFLIVEEESLGKRVYNQPAGHVESGETLVEAAIRETQEETGWKVEPTAVLGMYVHTSPHSQVTYYRTCFIANAIEHYPNQALDNGIIQALWLSPEVIKADPSRCRSPVVFKSIDDYLKGRNFPLDCIYEHS